MWLILFYRTHFAVLRWCCPQNVQFIICLYICPTTPSTTNQLTTSLTKPETFYAIQKHNNHNPIIIIYQTKVQLSLLFCDLITYDTILLFNSVIAIENQDGFKNSWNVFAINFRPLNKSQNSTKGSKRFI